MKILHTADLHLGKKLCQKSRMWEQENVLDEIIGIADEEKVDLIIAAGDIFDTSTPPAEAESLFYKKCLKLCKDRYFVAVSGNHDDALRFSAPKGIAKELNIFLVGGLENSAYSKNGVEGGEGYLKFDINGTYVNMLLFPYMSLTTLSNKENIELNYTEIIKDRLYKFGECFSDKDINIIAAHLFVTQNGGEDKDSLTDERELGTATLLPPSVFPKADYVALGHIHKPLTVSNKNNIYYSGSILPYSFDESGAKGSEKSVIIAEINFDGDGKKMTSVKRVNLKSGKKLLRAEVKTFTDALKTLEDNNEKLVSLVYSGEAPLKLSEVNEIKKHAAFVELDNICMLKREAKAARTRSDEEMFCDFYQFKNCSDAKPSKELIDMFLSVLNSEEEII